MKHLSRKEIIDLFASLKKTHFKKKGKFIYRVAVPGETILTIVSGYLETIRTAESNEIVIRNIELNSSAESYIIPIDTFEKRYSINDKKYTIDGIQWCECHAKGEIMAAQYDGETIEFMAPWNEPMVLVDGDWLANPIGGKETDIYRIEHETFDLTYFTHTI